MSSEAAAIEVRTSARGSFLSRVREAGRSVRVKKDTLKAVGLVAAGAAAAWAADSDLQVRNQFNDCKKALLVTANERAGSEVAGMNVNMVLRNADNMLMYTMGKCGMTIEPVKQPNILK